MSYVDTANSGADTFASSRANTKPAGVATGDIAVFYLGRWQSGGGAFPAVTPPSGAVLLDTLAVSELQLLVYAKYVQAGDSTYTFSWTGSIWGGLWSEYFTGRAASLDLSTLARQGTTGSGTAITSRSVTAAIGDDLSWGVDCHMYNGGETHTPPTSFTEIYDAEYGSAAHRDNVTSGTQTASGATISASQNFAVHLVALPAAGGGGSNLTQTPTDAEGLTDTAAAAVGKVFADSEGLTDGAALGTGKVLLDAEGLTDSTSVGLGRQVSADDTEALTDSAVISLGRQVLPGDSEGLTDTAVVAVGRTQAPTDAEGLADSAALDVGHAVQDVAGLTDSAQVDLSVAGGLSFTDVAGTTDSTSAAVGKNIADALGMTDAAQVSLSSAGNLTPADTENLTDSAALTAGKSLTEALGLTDAVQVDLFRQLSVTAADSETLADTAVLAKMLALSFTDAEILSDVQAFSVGASQSDSTGLTDGFQTELVAVRLYADALGLTDAVTLHLGPEVPARDLTLAGAIDAGRFSGTIAPGRYAGTLQPGRWKGEVGW